LREDLLKGLLKMLIKSHWNPGNLRTPSRETRAKKLG